MIGVIAAKEFRALFASPLAWVLLAVLQALLAWVFLGRLDAFLELQPRLARFGNAPGFTEMVAAPTFGMAALVLLMVMPLLTMRLIAEERRQQTLALLTAAPVSAAAIIVGKFLGLMAFLLLPVLMLVAMSASLAVGGAPDWGLIAANALGLALLAAAFAAVGLLFSTLATQPAVAAVASLGVLLGLWLLDVSAAETRGVLYHLSLMRRFENFNQGVFDSFDLTFLVMCVAVLLALAVNRLDTERWRG
ncbi:MAG: ABC transporter permease [Pseudomonadota bacterium]